MAKIIYRSFPVICLLAILSLNLVACTGAGTEAEAEPGEAEPAKTEKAKKEYTRSDVIALVAKDSGKCEKAQAAAMWDAERIEEGKWLIIKDCVIVVYDQNNIASNKVISTEEWYFYEDTGELEKL